MNATLRGSVVVGTIVLATPLLALQLYLMAWTLPRVTVPFVTLGLVTALQVFCLVMAWTRRRTGTWWLWLVYVVLTAPFAVALLNGLP